MLSSLKSRPRSLGELAQHVSGELTGDPALPIHTVNGLESASSGQISFFGNGRYKKELWSTKASAVLVGSACLATDLPPNPAFAVIRVSNPHLAFARISQLFHARVTVAPGVSARAFVHAEAHLHPTATVMHGATVESGATVGARTVLFPGSYIGENAFVGDECLVYPNVTVREECRIGNRCILHAGCVIGADGFGFAFDLEIPEHVKIPQVGIVRLEDDVEIGACSCIDRATSGETLIGRGTKIDNLVQIAHNVVVGPMSILCAQAGVSGSSELGTGVILAGQVGVVGHIRVGDLARVGAQSGVGRDVEDGATVSGSPAIPHREWLKAAAAYEKLSQLTKDVRELRKQVRLLQSANGQKEG